MISRRDLIKKMAATAGVAGMRLQGLELLSDSFAASPARAARPAGVLIESHIHMFSDDLTRFPINKLSYKPNPQPVEAYVKFVSDAQINHTVLVQPEPYQDDHSYLEYCFTKEPSKGFFKATCLFDPIDPATPKRLKDLCQKNPGRIVGMRIHELHAAGTPSTTTGAIRDRDLRDPQMETTWRAAHDLGIGILLQLIPHYASQVGDLAKEFPSMPVMLDHLARPGQGTAEEFEEVLKLGSLPNVYMKFTSTGVQSAATPAGGRGTSEAYPFPSVKPLIKKVYSAFGPDKIMWGELGANMSAFDKATTLFDAMFDFAPENDRKKIRGLTAQKLFAFS
jgi:predicted TIM-barrel fold metal-dependent hydrolase